MKGKKRRKRKRTEREETATSKRTRLTRHIPSTAVEAARPVSTDYPKGAGGHKKRKTEAPYAKRCSVWRHSSHARS